MSKMGFHNSFGHLNHKLWPKEGLRVKLTISFMTIKKSGIDPISMRVGGVQHTVEKLSTRAITLLQTSPSSEVCTQRYGPPKSQESQLCKFRDSHLGVPRQNAIWM